MTKFYCNGKKGYCDTFDGKITANCFGCTHHDETGGKLIESLSRYEQVKDMSIEELAEFINKCGWDFPPYCSPDKSLACDQNCLDCAKVWLESEVDGK